MNLKNLKNEFPSDRISWRVGSTTTDKTKGLALAYIDSRDVQDRLDEVCGPENWSDSYPSLGATTVCSISIRIGDVWVSKTDGAGSTDVEAEKGQLSDAFKRAAVKWGIGRYLYEDRFKGIWVEIEPMGKSYRIKKSELARLSKMFGGNASLKENTPQPLAVTPNLKQRMDAFSGHMDKLQSELSVTNLVASNNKLMAELKEKLPQDYEKLSTKINQTIEAFRLAEPIAAE